MPPFSIPPFSPIMQPIPLHSPNHHTPPTKATTKRKARSDGAKAPKRSRSSNAESKPVQRLRILSCNTTEKGVACDEKFYTSQQLVCHIANIHKKEEDHVCRTCAKFSLEKLMLWRRRIESEKIKSNLVPSGTGYPGKYDVVMIDK